LKQQFELAHVRVAQNKDSNYLTLFPKAMALELAFARAGGMLVAGTDPTGSGGVIPGYSNHRQIELLVDAGFTSLEAIRIATLNGATYLGREKSIGSVAVGKQADLLVVSGDPSARIADVRNVEIVFRRGIGYDPGKLIASVAGRVGLF
jgi:imidazolonepropionase-like amidohydrolase